MKQKGSPRFAVEAGSAPVLIVIIITVLVGGYLIYQNQTKVSFPPQITQFPPTPIATSAPTDSAQNTISIQSTFKFLP